MVAAMMFLIQTVAYTRFVSGLLQWYTLETSSMSDELKKKFLQSTEDEETKEFLTNCYEKAEWIFMQLYHSLARSLLSWFMSSTSVNG